jgi:hypothetical protein
LKKIKTILHSSLALAMAVPIVFAGHASAASWQVLYSSRWWNGTELVSQVVTPDGTDQPYVIEEWNDDSANPVPMNEYDVKFTAPMTNTGGNLREFIWPASTPDVMDSQTCAVWSKESEGFIQEGAALRINRAFDDEGNVTRTRGITVTKNIWYAASWVFNVHVWDTSRPGNPYTQIAGFDMSEVMGKMYHDENGNLQSNLKPFPWRFCARVVGDRLTFKVWTNPWVTPAWDDPKHTRTVTIPTEWVEPGKTGWYIGHVRPGQSAEYQLLHTHVLQ